MPFRPVSTRAQRAPGTPPSAPAPASAGLTPLYVKPGGLPQHLLQRLLQRPQVPSFEQRCAGAWQALSNHGEPPEAPPRDPSLMA